MRRIQLHVIITGELSGTSFRSMVRRQAEKLGVVGWVVQHPDGALELVANGAERDVRLLLSWCEHGPMASVVTEVRVTPQPREAFFDFSVRRALPTAE